MEIALQYDYHYIDLVAIYFNMIEINKGIRKNVGVILDKILVNLGVSYINLYLIYWPSEEYFPFILRRPWKPVQIGKVKVIEVSNLDKIYLKLLLKTCKIIPVVNQIEMHLYLQQSELAAFCQSRGILLEAYSPLGNNQIGELRTADNVKVHKIAKKLSLEPGQVLASRLGILFFQKASLKAELIAISMT
ncbi:hypothetical protein BTUL_0058g00530 [Botrytis tulipae]|uniref:NADP-dependent oxidoreductase domain-containing protein n=1 Tax=Botrytis tulipae TaxID=87230 RepID=A0A4Z1ESW1_9HELO|nr:hypothetical protein BTUL_0058g00530 [Botrytis tulipae]